MDFQLNANQNIKYKFHSLVHLLQDLTNFLAVQSFVCCVAYFWPQSVAFGTLRFISCCCISGLLAVDSWSSVFGLTPAMLAFYYILCVRSCVRVCVCVYVFGRHWRRRACQLTKALDRINKWYSIYCSHHSQFVECVLLLFPMASEIMKFICWNVTKVRQREMSRKTVAAGSAAAVSLETHLKGLIWVSSAVLNGSPA